MLATDFCHLIRETFTRTSHVPGPLIAAHAAGAPLEVWASKDLVGPTREFTVPGRASARPRRSHELRCVSADMGLLDPRCDERRPLIPLSPPPREPVGKPSLPGGLTSRSPRIAFIEARERLHFHDPGVPSTDRDPSQIPELTLPDSTPASPVLPRMLRTLSDAITPPWAFSDSTPLHGDADSVRGHVFARKRSTRCAEPLRARPPFTRAAFPFWGARQSLFGARCRLSTSATITTNGHKPGLVGPRLDGGRNPLPFSCPPGNPLQGTERPASHASSLTPRDPAHGYSPTGFAQMRYLQGARRRRGPKPLHDDERDETRVRRTERRMCPHRSP
jgi:hypothetical protein